MNATPFHRYVTYVGSRKEAAARLGISEAMVGHILTGIRGVSVRVAQRIDAETNGTIAKHDLRPDVWSEPAKAA